MNDIKRFSIVREGVIYREETGYQGYYARVVRLGLHELVCSFIASTIHEGPDCHPVITRSVDNGATWTVEGPVDRRRPKKFPPTETGFISRDSDGSLFCLGARWKVNPKAPDEGLINPKTVGMKDNDVVLRRSADGGRTWTAGTVVPKSIDCPFEIPTGLATLDDGTNLMSFATWKKWDGSMPFGHSIRIVMSRDHCRTWSAPVTVFHDKTNRVGYWEGRVTRAGGSRLFASSWTHDWAADKDLPNHYSTSHDRGRTWTRPQASPVNGQTSWPLYLGNDLFLFVYNHRRPPVGVKAQLMRLEGEKWVTMFDDMVWSPENKAVATISKDNYAVTGFQFGLPSAIVFDDRRLMVVYWCVVGGRAGINYTLVSLD